MNDWKKQAESVAKILSEANNAAAFTGAGISTESGIPDFRSPGGVWSENRQIYFDEYCSSEEARREYWRQKSIAHQDFHAAQPNVGHRVLAKWESRQRLAGLITQNIDGLHQEAGSKNVLELHGTAKQIACLDCDYRVDADPLVQSFLETNEVPRCPRCEGLLKHATVSFGQQLPEQVLREADHLARECDLMFAIGSSLVVRPAADIPQIAVSYGANLVIINRDPTPLDHLADVVISAGIGEVLEWIDDKA